MQIVDSIREANSTHVVNFLLIAYIRARRDRGDMQLLSQPISRLPINGTDDVARRFSLAMADLDEASQRLDDKACEIAKEAREVFLTAATRLKTLERRDH